MSDQFWLTRAQLKRIKRHFALSHGVARVDDLRVILGIIDDEDRGFERCPPVLIGDKGYDSDEFTNARAVKGIRACIPPRKGRKTKHAYCKTLYRQRHKVECLFGKIKDWRRITTRYDRCAHTFFSAICRATTVIFSLK